MLGGEIAIPAKTYLGWNSYGVHTNQQVWGPSARDFVPERWGKTVEEIQLKFRRDCVRGAFIPFNAHTRKCLGQGFVLLETKILLFELIRRLCWKVDPSYKLKLPGASIPPFDIICLVLHTEYANLSNTGRSLSARKM